MEHINVIQYKGSVDDIRCTLNLMDPVTFKVLNENLAYLKRSLEYEPGHLNRSTVIKMLGAKIRKFELIRKQFLNA